MNNIQTNEKSSQKKKSAETKRTFLTGITNTFKRFCLLDFDRRKIILAIVHREMNSEQDKELKSLLVQLESIFLDKHLKLVVALVREKYNLSGKVTEKDFYRICEGENITVVNSSPDPHAKKLKAGCVFTSSELEGEFFLNFDKRLKGKEKLRCQFHLLGKHFLHRQELPSAEQVFDKSETNKTQQEEAVLFALYFLDTIPAEVKND